jgi:hypothetical protein
MSVKLDYQISVEGKIELGKYFRGETKDGEEYIGFVMGKDKDAYTVLGLHRDRSRDHISQWQFGKTRASIVFSTPPLFFPGNEYYLVMYHGSYDVIYKKKRHELPIHWMIAKTQETAENFIREEFRGYPSSYQDSTDYIKNHFKILRVALPDAIPTELPFSFDTMIRINTKHCSNCHAWIKMDAEVRFCPYCGTGVRK